MTTIYCDSKHHNYVIPSDYTLSIGASGFVYGTVPIEIGAYGTIVNHGMIVGGFGSGDRDDSAIYAAGAGVKVVNFGTIEAVSTSALLYGYPSFGQVYAAIWLGGGTVVNYGLIFDDKGYGEFGIVSNGRATITNKGTISGNQGAIKLNLGGVITNDGTISSDGVTVDLAHGGKIVNASTGVIDSTGGPQDAIYTIGGFAATILNSGTIESLTNVGSGTTVKNSGYMNVKDHEATAAINVNSGASGSATVDNYSILDGVFFNGSGTLFNSGDIYSYAGVVVTVGTVSIDNQSYITSQKGAGVTISAGVVNVVNGGATNHGATIYGHVGVMASASAVVTVTNFGRLQGVSGAAAVELPNAADRLIVEAGSHVYGYAEAAGGTLELAPGTGSIGDLGEQFTGFDTYRVDAGGDWSLSGSDVLVAPLVNYGQVTITGSLTNEKAILHYGVTVAQGAILINAGSISTMGEAVVIDAGAVVANSGTIQGLDLGNAQGAVDFAGAGYISNATTGAIKGYNGVRGQDMSLTNSGLIEGYDSCAVYLTGGTSALTNGATGVMEGRHYGVFASGSATLINHGLITGVVAGVHGDVSVANYGTILGDAGGDGVDLANGGGLTLESGAIVGGAGAAPGAAGGTGVSAAMGGETTSLDIAAGMVEGGAGQTGLADAYGADPGNGGAGGAGLVLASGATLSVGHATVSGGTGGAGGLGLGAAETGGAGGAGVVLGPGASLYNAGVVTGGAGGDWGLNRSGPPGTSGAGGAGVLLAGGGEVTNRGTLTGAAEGSVAGAGGTFGQAGDGVSVQGGGTVVNLAGGVISGYDGVGQGAAGALTVVDYGSISGASCSVLFESAADGLVLHTGARLTGVAEGGGGTLELTGGDVSLTGLGSTGVLSGAVAATVSNFGIYQVDTGATLDVTGVVASGRTLVNLGWIEPPVASSLNLAGGGEIVNSGVIAAFDLSNAQGAVEADSGGGIVNEAGSAITGYNGVRGAGFSFANAGEVDGFGNCGVLITGGTAVVGNAAGGTLFGQNYGVVSLNAATVTNAGSIYGQIASVEFRNAASLLVVQSGAEFGGGTIRGGGGTLELQGGADTLTGLGGSGAVFSGDAFGAFGGFDAYEETGGSLSLAGSESLIAARTLINAGEILITGTLTNAGHMLGAAGPTGGAYSNAPAGPGGAGFTAASVAGGTLTDTGTILGGAGGTGGAGATYLFGGFAGGDGGLGGAGLTLASGALKNLGDLVGGAGGEGGAGSSIPVGPAGLSTGGSGGDGGAGLTLTGGTATSSRVIEGGDGGAGGYCAILVFGGAGGSGGAGVDITGGTLISSGQILGGAGGAGFDDGKAGAAGDGIIATGAGRVANAAGGLIRGLNGVEDAGSGGLTVINAGSIAGTDAAILFTHASDRLIVDSGAAFTGSASGGGGTLELAEVGGTISGLGGTASLTGSANLTFSGFGTYRLDAGTWVVRPGAAVAAAQHLDVENGVTAQVSGALADAGVIALVSTGASSRTELDVLNTGATLSGGGTVTLGGPKSLIAGDTTSATLVNVNDTIKGQGWLGISLMTLVNDANGVVDSVGSHGLVVNTKGETLTNAGLIESSNGSTLSLQSTTVANVGGTLLALAGGRVVIEDGTIIGGTLGSEGTGLIIVNASGGAIEGANGAVTLTGLVQVNAAAALTLEGAIDDTGKLTDRGGALIVGAGGVTLSGGGEVDSTVLASNTIIGAAAGDVLTNVNDRIAWDGEIGDGSMGLDNEAAGAIVGVGDVNLTIDMGANIIINAGAIDSQGSASVIIETAVANTGTLYAYSGALVLQQAVTGGGVGRIDDGTLGIESAFSEEVIFAAGGTGVLELGDWAGFTGVVKGLSLTGANHIDLSGFSLAGAEATFTGSKTSGVLTVTNGTQTAVMDLTGDYLGSKFTVASDSHGGVIVADPPVAAPQAVPAAAVVTQAMASFQVSPGSATATAPACKPPDLPLAVPGA